MWSPHCNQQHCVCERRWHWFDEVYLFGLELPCSYIADDDVTMNGVPRDEYVPPRRLYNQQYYQRHRTERLAYKQQWYATNRDAICAKRLARRIRMRELKRAAAEQAAAVPTADGELDRTPIE